MAAAATSPEITPPALEPPVLLLATPRVLDPFFHRSVVLLLQHGEEGSLGFILNRRTEIKVAEILSGLEIAWEGEEGANAYFGGPVQPQLGTVLFREQPGERIEVDPETAVELAPGLRMTQHVGSLAELASAPPEFFRLVLGYAGWSEGQLVEEVSRNDWLVARATDELLFDTAPDTIWDRALEGLGIEPESLAVFDSDSDPAVN